jgi:hypothetical protein
MDEQELRGLTAMATTASNLTLQSVLATLNSAIKPEETLADAKYNQGLRDAIQVVQLYKVVLNAENTARSKNGR